MHEGHRQRMYEKLKNDDGLLDHELLEILLFNALPRKNTNELAHMLIKTFGSLSGVLNADVNQLTQVSGVGENTALYLKLVAEVKRRTSTEAPCIAVLKNHSEFKPFVASRLRGKNAEVLELYCLDKNGRVGSIHPFTNDDINQVEVRADNIMKLFSAEKPYGLILAHNHLSGSSQPSDNDDYFTAKILLMCSVGNIQLYDHLIYASDRDIFSYFLSGRIESMRNEFNFSALVDEKMKQLYGKKL